MRSPVLVYGAGRLGQQVLHHLQHHTTAEVLGYLDDTKPRGAPAPGGHVCLGGLAAVAHEPGFEPDRVCIVFAIGYADMPARGQALGRVIDAGYRLFTVIHPRAIVEPGSRVGEGSIVLAGAIVDQNVTLGRACYVDIGVRIGEDSTVGDNTYLSSGAALGGAVSVGSGSFFGMGATVVTGVNVGAGCFVNAQALVARDLPAHTHWVELRKGKELPRVMAGTPNDEPAP